MAIYYFWYDICSGYLFPASQAQPGVPVPPGWGIPLDAAEIAWDTAATPSAEEVWWHPDQYRVVNGQIVSASYWQVMTTTGPSGTVVMTATLQNPPAPPPEMVSISTPTAAFTLPFSGTTAEVTIQVHPSLQEANIPLTITASGTATGSVVLGNPSGAAPPPLQWLPSGAGYYLAPSGNAGFVYLQGYYAGLQRSQDLVGTLSQSLQSMYVIDALTLHLLLGRIVPALMSGGILSLGADEVHALADAQENLLPYLDHLALNRIYPSGGSRVIQYEGVLAQAPLAAQASQAFANDLATIPNLLPS